MERKVIEEEVRNFLIEDLEIEEEKIAPEAKLKDDLGIDSLDFVDIVVIVEKNFGFKIKPEEISYFLFNYFSFHFYLSNYLSFTSNIVCP